MHADLDNISIPAMAEIRRNADGLVRFYETDFCGDFIWCDGNFACDCNREIFFCSVAGEDDSERGCGDEAYSVRISAIEDGRTLYEDHDYAR